MIWSKPKPWEIRETRVRKRFAWLPVLITGDRGLWLEYYIEAKTLMDPTYNTDKYRYITQRMPVAEAIVARMIGDEKCS